MGFLKIFGKALEFEESKEYHDTIRRDALEKIITWVNLTKGKCCCPKFGYEVKYSFYIDRIPQDSNQRGRKNSSNRLKWRD